MIITKESEVFQKLLKDVEYIKQALTFSGKYYIGCDPISEKPTPSNGNLIINLPNLKVGEWVIGMGTHTPFYPALVTNINYNAVSLKCFHGESISEMTQSRNCLIYAANSTTETHLKHIATERGFVHMARFKWKDKPNIGTILLNIDGFGYDCKTDTLYVEIAEDKQPTAIYHKGEWATTVYRQTPMPNSIYELRDLLVDYTMRLTTIYGNKISSIEDRYIYDFLKIKGYK